MPWRASRMRPANATAAAGSMDMPSILARNMHGAEALIVADALEHATRRCLDALAQQGVRAAGVACSQRGDLRVRRTDGNGHFQSCFQPCTIGAQPSTWMPAIGGTRASQPHALSSPKPLSTPSGPKPPEMDWKYQSGARQGAVRAGKLPEAPARLVSQLPGELLGYLESDRLHAFHGGIERGPRSRYKPRWRAYSAATFLAWS